MYPGAFTGIGIFVYSVSYLPLYKLKRKKMFAEIRRKERAMEPQQVREALECGEHGILSMCGVNGYGYGIPLNYVLEDNHLYFHCAVEGEKLRNLSENNKVSFCVVQNAEVIADKFTTNYQSIIAFGKATFVSSEDEIRRAMLLLVKKYSPEYMETGEKYINQAIKRIQVIRLDIEHLTGKSNR
jgi:nitroimidazol reductase NimA-like FMN-containing flavoprotein (pyridoxamine 5'-phosphate oxidase superfamily)